MLDRAGFDLWADGYDKAVGVSDEENSYPFAGYKRILGAIYETVLQKQTPRVLDIGFGTGTLTARLYEQGCDVYGQDFSARMLDVARKKMPQAHLYQGDFSKGLAEPLACGQYDFIVSTYALHHLTDAQKIGFLRLLLSRLLPDGQLLIGDVAFETRAELERCRAEAGDEWDDDEIYFVAQELRREFPKLRFVRMSPCAGILSLTREDE